jgi:hypothetical protein
LIMTEKGAHAGCHLFDPVAGRGREPSHKELWVAGPLPRRRSSVHYQFCRRLRRSDLYADRQIKAN